MAASIVIDSTDTLESAHNQLWTKIEQDQISDNKTSLLKRCQLYLLNCEQRIFENCEYKEDVLFYTIGLVHREKREKLIAKYNKAYPEGKYLEAIDQLNKKPKEVVIPIVDNFATLDYDENTILINKVKGGNKPYFIGFYDYKKNKKLAVKSHRFNKEDLSMNLKELGIPKGLYTVRVMDSKGQLFLEKKDIYVNKAIQIPKSIRLSLLLLLLTAMGFLYKKYIHF